MTDAEGEYSNMNDVQATRGYDRSDEHRLRALLADARQVLELVRPVLKYCHNCGGTGRVTIEGLDFGECPICGELRTRLAALLARLGSQADGSHAGGERGT